MGANNLLKQTLFVALALIPSVGFSSGPICTDALSLGHDFKSLKDYAAIFTKDQAIDPQSCQVGYMGTLSVPYTGVDGQTRPRRMTGTMIGKCIMVTATSAFMDPKKAAEALVRKDPTNPNSPYVNPEKATAFMNAFLKSARSAKFKSNGTGNEGQVTGFFPDMDYMKDDFGLASAGLSVAFVQHNNGQHLVPVNDGFNAKCKLDGVGLTVFDQGTADGQQKQDYPAPYALIKPSQLGTDKGRQELLAKLGIKDNTRLPISVLGSRCKDMDDPKSCEFRGSKDDAVIYPEYIRGDGTLLIAGNASEFGGRGSAVSMPVCLKRVDGKCVKAVDKIVGIVTHASMQQLDDDKTGKKKLADLEVQAGTEEHEACMKTPDKCLTKVTPISNVTKVFLKNLRERVDFYDVNIFSKKNKDGQVDLSLMDRRASTWLMLRTVQSGGSWNQVSAEDKKVMEKFDIQNPANWSEDQKKILLKYVPNSLAALEKTKAELQALIKKFESADLKDNDSGLREYDDKLASHGCQAWY